MNIENLIADTINNNPIKMELRGKTLEIPRPTLGTLIEVSKHIATLPQFEIKQDMTAVVKQTLAIAKDCERIPEILAILLLGSKNLVTEVRVFGRTIFKRDRVKPLAKKLEDLNAQEISDILVKVFSEMNAAFFLGVITSLNGINMTKPTTTETTVHGQQSQVS